MKTVQSYLAGIYQNGLAACLEFDHSLQLVLQPGQFMMVRSADDILPVPLFPCGMQGFQYTSPLCGNHHWNVGDLFSISLPHGSGFDVSGKSRRLLMVSSTSSPLRLFPIAANIIQNGGEAALYTKNLPDHVPLEMELLSLEQLAEAVSWADCIIGDTSTDQLVNWKNELLDGKSTTTNLNIQILVDTPLVCAGTANCGICAIKTRHGWKQACTDGPVFHLVELES
jgi:NAD(P)H-flavin reductase